ncbi:DNA polymerase III subunit delta' [Immundisolibacter sp.]|uniref:DNA polymerase III subunit delta' n=1 Tax=Immundisolibacter sp. TaxID=1934948 RepID=UPI000EE30767|nr:DNA polymerase III subunit delta' [Gammaproteobacteria bacterium]
MNAPLPWQTTQWRTVGRARAGGRLHHALLAAGPPGIGKAQFLEALAATLLCDAPREDSACGECRSCRQHAAGTHPDCTVLSPDPLQRAAFSSYPGQRCQHDSSRKKPATIISVDQVRELRERLHASAHYGAHKLAVLLPADALNTAAANALLKLLEEPPDNTVFLLLSQRVASLPATLRSRCQLLRFSTPPASVARTLVEQDDPASALALDLAGGAPLRARDLLAQDVGAVWQTVCQGLAGLLGGASDPLSLARECVKLPPDTLATTLHGWLRQALRRASGQPGDAAVAAAAPARLQAFAQELDQFLRLQEHPLARELALQRLFYPLWAGNTTPFSAKPEQS